MTKPVVVIPDIHADRVRLDRTHAAVPAGATPAFLRDFIDAGKRGTAVEIFQPRQPNWLSGTATATPIAKAIIDLTAT